MKNRFIQCLMLSAIPILGFAQEPEMVTAAESKDWALPDLLPLVLWPVGVFVALLIICFLALRPLRKRGSKKAKILTVVLPIIGWAIWHFYPSLTYRGYYEGKYEWFDETKVVSVEIRDTYILKGTEEVPDDHLPYQVKPFHRLLWVKLDSPYIEEIPVKLGWNKVYQPVFKVGFVKLEKMGEPVVRLYGENAQSSTSTVMRTESHP